MKLFILFFIILIGASNAIAEPELHNNFKWVKSDRPALPHTVIYYNSNKQLVKACAAAGVVNKKRFSLIFGCAEYNPRAGWCKVHVGPYDQEKTLKHEIKHCKGWDHE